MELAKVLKCPDKPGRETFLRPSNDGQENVCGLGAESPTHLLNACPDGIGRLDE